MLDGRCSAIAGGVWVCSTGPPGPQLSLHPTVCTGPLDSSLFILTEQFPPCRLTGAPFIMFCLFHFVVKCKEDKRGLCWGSWLLVSYYRNIIINQSSSAIKKYSFTAYLTGVRWVYRHNTAQLCVFIRMVFTDMTQEKELLTLLLMKECTQGEFIFQSIKYIMEKTTNSRCVNRVQYWWLFVTYVHYCCQFYYCIFFI